MRVRDEMRSRSWLAAAAAVIVGWSTVAGAAPRDDVLVLVNGRHEGSAAVAERYRQRHGIPEAQVLTLQVERTDQVSRETYVRDIEQPVARWFHRHAAHDRIAYIVIGPGFPLRVAGTVGRSGTVASVDSELAVLYRTMAGGVAGPVGPVQNPYFIEAQAEGRDGWPAFDRARLDTYLVGRLDGFTTDDALGLVARCEAADAARGSGAIGRFVLDDRAPLDVREHRWFATAAERLADAVGADRVVFDRTLSTVQHETDVMGYYSWGAADPGNRVRPIPLTFRPGALVASLSSTDARTLAEPPAEWRPGSWQQRDTYFRGSPEWLAGDLIRAGASGVVANVADPYGDGAVRPDVMFPAYVSGRTLGEAVWMATPSLSWQTVLFGDPLCQPFGTPSVPASTFTTHQPSNLTQPFFDRLVDQAAMKELGTPREAVAAMVSARALLEQQQRDAAIAVLDGLAASHPSYVPGLVLLGQTLEAAGQQERAVEAYRAVLAQAPNDLVALNNLAYILVETPDGTAEALALARRAFDVSRGAPVVADTYGWVLLRSGDVAQATRVLRDAVARQPRMAELRIHLARALLASGEVAEARTQWEEAVKLSADAPGHQHAGPLVETFAVKPSDP